LQTRAKNWQKKEKKQAEGGEEVTRRSSQIWRTHPGLREKKEGETFERQKKKAEKGGKGQKGVTFPTQNDRDRKPKKRPPKKTFSLM